MGGAFPGAYPPPMRVAAVLQIAVLAGCAGVILSRAGLLLQRWRQPAQWLAWVVVGIFAVSLGLNLMTPSAVERLVWSPIASGLLVSATYVAASGRSLSRH